MTDEQKQKLQDYRKEYYKNNRDVILNRTKEYYINNKESIQEHVKNKCKS